jgi:hypothetical protein
VSDWSVVPDSSADWTVVRAPASPLIDGKAHPSSRRAAAGMSPGPREYSDEELGIDSGPQTVVTANHPEGELYKFGPAGPVHSMVDRYSLGAYGAALRLAKRIDEATGTQGGASAQALSDIEGYRATHPDVAAFTDAPAYIGAPTSAVAHGMERALPEVAHPLARAAKATLASGGTGAVIGGTEATMAGGDLNDVERAAEAGGIGGLMGGAAVATPLSLTNMAARAVLGSRGGQARQFLQGHGVEVGPTTPGRGGPMDTMATKGTSDADIGIQESVSARKGLGMLREDNRGIRAGIGIAKNRVADTPEAATTQDVTDIVAKMNEAASKIGVNDSVATKLKNEIGRITEAQGVGFNPDTDNYLLSQTEINDLRAKLMNMGGVGKSTDAKLRPLADAAMALQAITSEGPYADVNQRFEAEYARHGRAREQIGLSPTPSKKPGYSKQEISTVKNLIGRAGQNIKTSGSQKPELDAFKAENPDIGEEFARPEILRKRADIGFSLLPKRHGGLTERLGSGIGGLATVEAITHALSSGHFDLKTAAAAGALGLTMQNLPALEARLLYGPAAATAGLLQLEEPAILGAVPYLQAARNTMEKR